MVWRITEAQLRDFVRTDDSVNLAIFIDLASTLTDRVEANDIRSVLSQAELAKIELLLACHFYGHRDQPVSSKSTMGASGAFQGQWGMGLDSTRCGQSAKILDSSGTLAALSAGGGFASIDWLGKPPSEQIAYVDRD